MIRFALLSIALLVSSAAQAQGPFDPPSVAYVLCVSNEMKKLALQNPPLEKDSVIERAFGACGSEAADIKSSDRLSQIQKFIRQTAQDEIDRVRANQRPR